MKGNTIDLPGFKMWLDDDGVLCFVAKPKEAETSIDEAVAALAGLFELAGDQPRRMFADATHASPVPREVREALLPMVSERVKHMAIVVRRPLARMLLQIIFTVKPPGFTYKMFRDPVQARDWLMKQPL